jgi:hypothetical protein
MRPSRYRIPSVSITVSPQLRRAGAPERAVRQDSDHRGPMSQLTQRDRNDRFGAADVRIEAGGLEQQLLAR